MGLEQNAGNSAERCAERIYAKHGQRALVIGFLIAQTELAIAKCSLSKEEWQTVIQELQAAYDDHTAFLNKN